MVPARVKTQYIIRFTVTSYHTTETDIERDWRIIQSTASKVTREVAFGVDEFHLVASTSPIATTTGLAAPKPTGRNLLDSTSSCSSIGSSSTEQQRFQSSLLLSNVPQTPKVVNASFLAFFPDMELTLDIAKELTKRDYAMSHFPLKPRRKLRNKSNRLGMSFDNGQQRARWSSLSSSSPPSNLNTINNNNNKNINETNETNRTNNNNNDISDDLSLNELKIRNGNDENGINGRRFNYKYEF